MTEEQVEIPDTASGGCGQQRHRRLPRQGRLPAVQLQEGRAPPGAFQYVRIHDSAVYLASEKANGIYAVEGPQIYEQGGVFSKFAVGLFLAFACFHSAQVYAHAYPVLEAAVPGPGAVLQKAPETVCIRFNNLIQRNLSRLIVTDGQGESFQTGELEYREGNAVCILLRPLEPSTYHIHWSVVGRDGHRTEGDYEFILQ